MNMQTTGIMRIGLTRSGLALTADENSPVAKRRWELISWREDWVRFQENNKGYSFGPQTKSDKWRMSVPESNPIVSDLQTHFLLFGLSNVVKSEIVTMDDLGGSKDILTVHIPEGRNAPVERSPRQSRASVAADIFPSREEFAAAVRTVNDYKIFMEDVLELSVTKDGALRATIMEEFT